VTDEVIVVMTTVATALEAEQLAAALIETRLAACVQLIPVESRYVWKDGFEAAKEVRLEAKTLSRLYPKIEAAIRARHPYELPEILAVPVFACSPAYAAWIAETVV